MAEEYDFYEDDEPGLKPAIKRNKQPLILLFAFLACTMVFSCIDRQFDSMESASKASGRGESSGSNPWAKDK